MKISIASPNKFLEEALTSAGFLVLEHSELVIEDSAAKVQFQDKMFAKPIKLTALIEALRATQILELDFTLFKLDPIERVCFNDHERVNLTEKEIEVLKFFYDSNYSVSKESLLQKVWGYNADTETTTLETHISRLRQKLKVFADKDLFISLDGHFKMLV
ncbi:MAG: winged helix-turn-helix domain-containing protein [Rickettsiales bacterium]